jgi:hypothetical protein
MAALTGLSYIIDTLMDAMITEIEYYGSAVSRITATM